MKNRIDFAKALIALHVLLSPFVLATVAYWVIHSDFNGFIEMALDRNGGKVILYRRTPPAIPDPSGNN
jgi:hypothetical protein